MDTKKMFKKQHEITCLRLEKLAAEKKVKQHEQNLKKIDKAIKKISD